MLGLLASACGTPIGGEGGPCTTGGACDPGLVCLSALCVDGATGEGEGEGEGECQGDEPAQNDRADCTTIPTAACAPLDENAAVQTCDLAGAQLRSGLFQAAFDCIATIPEASCASVNAALDACFGSLTACPNPGTDTLCDNVAAQCASEDDDGFPTAACKSDMQPTNQGFRDAYAVCFNNAVGTPCSDVHDNCYNIAINTVVAK